MASAGKFRLLLSFIEQFGDASCMITVPAPEKLEARVLADVFSESTHRELAEQDVSHFYTCVAA